MSLGKVKEFQINKSSLVMIIHLHQCGYGSGLTIRENPFYQKYVRPFDCHIGYKSDCTGNSPRMEVLGVGQLNNLIQTCTRRTYPVLPW